METGQRRRGTLVALLGLVLLLRLPFLNQAIQGDDVYYLAGAEHAQIEPLHPNHVRYVFLGDEVDLRGHSHPPLNAWWLALLLAALGDIREVPFHAAYLLFSIIAVVAMWSLARRFSPQPLWATLLFVAVPAFVINGTSLESDLPLLAFWLAAVALFVAGRLALAAAALVLAALTAYQAIFLTPILMVWVWLHRRRDRAPWAVTLVPPLALLVWQVFERLSTGALPASVLTGYFQTYGFQAFERKLRSALALSVHVGFIVFPLLLPGTLAAAWKKRREPDTIFLAAWILLFFAGAVTVFFAGSARYLLPLAAPLCLLASRLRAKWLAAGFAAQLALSLTLATVNYQHWDGYRRFAATLRTASANRRIWINGEWGLRYYLEADGGLPLRKGQPLQPGEIVVSSELMHPAEVNAPLVSIAQMEIRPALPFRLLGVEAKSGYSTASEGLRPFDISTGLIDRVEARLVVERRPTLSYLPMKAPQAQEQIVSGIYQLEGAWRWMSGAGVVVLKSPPAPRPLELVFSIPAASPVRRVRLLLDGREVAAATYPAPGSYTLRTPPLDSAKSVSTVTIAADRTFTVPNDRRPLSFILVAVGFR